MVERLPRHATTGLHQPFGVRREQAPILVGLLGGPDEPFFLPPVGAIQLCRGREHLLEAAIPCDQIAVGIDDGKSLAHVIEGGGHQNPTDGQARFHAP